MSAAEKICRKVARVLAESLSVSEMSSSPIEK
jgi:hypothetical protein